VEVRNNDTCPQKFSLPFLLAAARSDWTGVGHEVLGVGHEVAGAEDHDGVNELLEFEQAALAVVFGEKRADSLDGLDLVGDLCVRHEVILRKSQSLVQRKVKYF
jgi:hypothetical protein